MADPKARLEYLRSVRQCIQCTRSLGDTWRVVWLEGKERRTSSNGPVPLRRLVERKYNHLVGTPDKPPLYEPGSEQHVHMTVMWANLAWVLEQIDAAVAQE